MRDYRQVSKYVYYILTNEKGVMMAKAVKSTSKKRKSSKKKAKKTTSRKKTSKKKPKTEGDTG